MLKSVWAASAAFFGIMLATPSAAQTMTVSQALDACPGNSAARICVDVAERFLEAHAPAGSRRDLEIIALAGAQAEAVQGRTVRRAACMDVASGMRVLAAGTTDAERARQINDIADALCANARTASISPNPSEFQMMGSESEGSSTKKTKRKRSKHPDGITPEIPTPVGPQPE